MAREMKDSGVEWIGEIPVTWNVSKIKHSFSIYTGATPKSENPDYWDGGVSWITPADFKTHDKYVSKGKRNITSTGYDSCGTTLVPANSLVFSKRAPVGTVAITNSELCTNQGCLSCVPKYGANSIFYYYVMSVFTEQFELVSTGTTFKEIATEMFANFKLPNPSTEEQQRIASFLDTECSRIDSVIEQTCKSIEEYKKLKQAVITQAVTKGIRPDREMKDSGIEWIGEIPAEWMIYRGKNILQILERPVRDDDGVITCFRDGEVTLRSKRREEGFTFSMQEIGYQGIEKGDLVVHGMDGFAGAIGISDSRGKGSPVLNVLDSQENKRYLMYYLRSAAYCGLFLSLSTGIRVRSCDTNWNKLKNIMYILPPDKEQDEIVQHIDQKIAEADAVIKKKELFLAELEQYKKSLIFEYVTGKKEVPA